MSTVSAFDPQARYAALDERVTNVRSSLVNLEGEMRSGFTTINTHLNNLANELRNSQKTPWGVIITGIGVGLSIIVAIGTLAYIPIQRTTEDLSSDLIRLQESSVSRSEYEQGNQRGSETRRRFEEAFVKLMDTTVPRNELSLLVAESRADRTRLNQEVTSLSEKTVTRAEWEERNRARDNEVTELSRRIDELSRNSAATYGLRDVIQDLKEQVRFLELQSFGSTSRRTSPTSLP